MSAGGVRSTPRPISLTCYQITQRAWMGVSTAASGPRDSALFAYHAGGAGPLLRNVRPMNALRIFLSVVEVASLAGATIVATILVTRRLCRYQVARKREPSLGTVFAGACFLPLLLAVVGTICSPDVWRPQLHKAPRDLPFLLLGSVTVLSIFTAPWVVRHYRKSTSKK